MPWLLKNGVSVTRKKHIITGISHGIPLWATWTIHSNMFNINVTVENKPVKKKQGFAILETMELDVLLDSA